MEVVLPLKEFSKHPHFKRGPDSSRNGTAALLFNVVTDIDCSEDVAADHPEVVTQLSRMAELARIDLGDRGRPGSGQRKPGKIENPKALRLDGQH